MKHGIESPTMLQGQESPVKVAGTVKEFDVDSPDPEIGFIHQNIVFPERHSEVFPLTFMRGVHFSRQ